MDALAEELMQTAHENIGKFALAVPDQAPAAVDQDGLAKALRHFCLI